MFAAVHGVAFGYVLCGVIIAVMFGLAVGNYACSLVHRLPRGKLLLDKTPYCGSCGHLLGVKDLFPVLSALSLKHRCRYCGVKFPTSHTWTEALVALLFVLAFLQHGFTEQFFLIAFIGVFLITLAAIEANDHMIMGKVLLCVGVSGMLYRTLLDHSIYNFFAGALIGGMIGAALMHKHIKKVGHVYVLPLLAQLPAVGGLCVGLSKLPVFLALFAAFYIAGRLLKLPITAPFGLAVMAIILYF
jgi:leader peptidase (prepilin peptidase) / N-methyltransferase